ncbi:MAG: RNA polymerase sigma factor [Oscillospiraceae bacterium]|nr:RNA polymerase sigma factor [Oscillospiraceae bacterium]
MDSKLFKEEYLPLHRGLYSQAMKMLGNREEAEDAVQSLYLKLWEQHNKLHSIKDKKAYCHTILSNICNDRWRNLSKQYPEELNEDIPDEQNNIYEATDFENTARLYISKLPEIQRRVMLMRLEGATTDEICHATGLSETNIRTILWRVRKQLKKLYR